MTSPAHDPANPSGLDQDAERRMAWRMVGLVLLTLTVAKTIAAVPFIGAAALTFAAIIQLYIPLWRAQKLDLDHDFVGLHRQGLATDIKWVFVLILVTFPPYALAHFWFMTEAHQWLESVGAGNLARWVPEMRFAPSIPSGERLIERAGWFFQMAATHALGVALPEETFYRGYLQPRLESADRPKTRVLGVPIGRAAVLASALFAAGHVLGEWNPLRLGPFLPGLVFAWQRNASGSVLGAIAFHALCNILGEVLFSLYVPM
ncbi:MAG: type II CAAX endopeptidase family protein [Myxococcota bacterium]